MLHCSSEEKALRDPYGRVIDTLRVLVTLRCNYKCIFCHSEGVFHTSREELNPLDYGFIARTACKLGVRNYKLTGGEPLLREDIAEIVRSIRPFAKEISLVTNGSLLAQRIGDLARAGLDRINVSLHSLKAEKYSYITGGSKMLDAVTAGIDQAIKYGLKVKINFLAMRSNVDEFQEILAFAEHRGLNVNLIELIPLGVPEATYSAEHSGLGNIVDYLERASASKRYRELHNRPVYLLNSGIEVEVVVGYNNYFFCEKCSRLRLTPDACLKPCLYVEDPCVSILEPVKSRDEEKLIHAFRKVTALRRPYFARGEK
ncbi:MAG: GTP 3',8-cyclase MoaA [Desulfurococcaceae archaeon]